MIVYLLSDIDKALAFEWLATGLRERGEEVRWIIYNRQPGHLEAWLQAKGFMVIPLRVRNKADWPIAFRATVRLLREWRPQTVHTHLLTASILGLGAAKLAGVPQRVMTRHHGSQHHRYHPKGVYWDRLCNRLATDIVAISRNVADILIRLDKAAPHKVRVIPHGFDFRELNTVTPERVADLRRRYALPEGAYLVGCIARLIELKGHRYVIAGFAAFAAQVPQAHLVLANARGADAAAIQAQLQATLSPQQYTLIPFEADLAALYACIAVLVQVPIAPDVEAFGQTYIEALATGTPLIATLSGIAPEILRDRENALVVPFADSAAITVGLHTLFHQTDLRNALVAQGQLDATTRYSILQQVDALLALYQ